VCSTDTSDFLGRVILVSLFIPLSNQSRMLGLALQ
jgi:hypothetical protein